MPDLGSATFSQTDGSNNTGTMPSWDGAAAPSTIDDAGRALQGAITREWNWRNTTLTAGGTANAKTLTYSVAPAALYNGQKFSFISNTINTSNVTLNVNSLGAKDIKVVDATGTANNLVSGQMPAGQYVEVTYNSGSGNFIWTNYGNMRGLIYLGSMSTASGTSVSLTGIPQNVRSVLCELSDVSFTSTVKLQLALSGDNGGSYGTAVDVSGALSIASTSFVGSVWIDCLQGGTVVCAVRPSVIDRAASTIYTTAVPAISSAAPCNAIKFSGGTFDGGTILVYGLV